MKHTVPVVGCLVLMVGALLVTPAQAQSPPNQPPAQVVPAYQNGQPPPVATQPVPVPVPAPMLPTRSIRDPSGLVLISPPQYPPGVYRQPANTCFVSYWQYPEVDRNNDGRLAWGELSRFCRNQR